MDRVEAIVWLIAAVVLAVFAFDMATAPPADWTGWAATVFMAGVAVFAAVSGGRVLLAGLSRAPARREVRGTVPVRPAPAPFTGMRVPLETQVETLAAAGLALNPGVTLDDLLYSYDRHTYETEPYDAILFIYCSEIEREPWGRAFTNAGWNFDTECLEERGDYVRVLQRVARLTGQAGLVTGLSDTFSIDAATCTITYAVNGVSRTLTAKVNNDWADVEALMPFFRDVEEALVDGRRFWAGDNGQSILMFLIPDRVAEAINRLGGNELVAFVPRD